MDIIINKYYQIARLWIEDHYEIFELMDAILFFIFLAIAVYLLIFVIASLVKKERTYPSALTNSKIIIFYSVFHDEEYIFDSLKSLPEQDYPREFFSVLVIAAKCSNKFIDRLREYDIKLTVINSDKSSLTDDYRKAMNELINVDDKYNIALILKPGNIMGNDMLTKLNDAYYNGCDAIQTHRVAKEMKKSVTILDAVSEEINNTIFRNGHTSMGFSSALIGSGMAFDFKLFAETLAEIKDYNLEKQLELALLKRNIYIEYLEDVYTYDDKANNSKSYYTDRGFWFRNLHSNLRKNIFTLPKYIFKGQLDYCNKIVQWMLPPRIIMCLFVAIIMTFIFFINWVMSIKWFALLCLLFFIFALAIPGYLVDKKFMKALFAAPILFLWAFMGIFSSMAKRR